MSATWTVYESDVKYLCHRRKVSISAACRNYINDVPLPYVVMRRNQIRNTLPALSGASAMCPPKCLSYPRTVPKITFLSRPSSSPEPLVILVPAPNCTKLEQKSHWLGEQVGGTAGSQVRMWQVPVPCHPAIPTCQVRTRKQFVALLSLIQNDCFHTLISF